MSEDFNKRKLTRHLVEYTFRDIYPFDTSPSYNTNLRAFIEVRGEGLSIVGRKLRQCARSLPHKVKSGIYSFLDSKKSKESKLIAMTFLLTLDVFREPINNYIEGFATSISSNDIADILSSDKLATSKNINNHLRKRDTTRYIFISKDLSIHLYNDAILKSNTKTYRAVLLEKDYIEQDRVLAIVISMPKMGDNLEKSVLKAISDRTEEMRLDSNPQISLQLVESSTFITVTIVRKDSTSEGRFVVHGDEVSELRWDKKLDPVVL